MAEQSGFFNANLVNGEFDRVYLAEHFAKYFASFISNGVFGGKSNELMVVQSGSSSMKIELSTGMGWINGYWYENTSSLPLDVPVADGVFDRIDNVVLRFGRIERSIQAVVVKGVPASKAVAPTIQRTADFYELKLAEVFVKAGATKITQANITDTRLDSDVCGFVVGLIQQFDTSEFGEQLNGYIRDFASSYNAFLEELELNSVKELESLFARLNALANDESPLATLAVEIDGVASEAALANQTLGYSKKNLIPFPYIDGTKETNGIKWTNNGDGSVTANGTAIEDSYFFLYKSDIILPVGKYVVSSNVDDSSKSYFAYALLTDKTTGTGVKDAFRSYDTAPFEITKLDLQNCNLLLGISVLKGTTVSNLVFKPMIRKAEIIDGTWEPYRLSVAEMIQEDEVEKGCFYRINRFTKVKEWLNAPDKPGIEYCLVERWNGKPVYQKTFYAASLPVDSAMSIHADTEWDKVVSVSGYAHDADDLTYYPFPIILHGEITPIAVISNVESDGSIVITTSGDASYFQAYITIKYTK